ncbi:MAG TPA: formate dehydrogenase subunit alpha [Candidatus Sulfotelmatobacter sp.]|nr:formate dehydrogenase subunit alpha [Candidatus Sulfotelmatobacter sp.]
MDKKSKRVLTTCVYCGTGCNLYLHVDNGRIVGATPVESHPVSQGKLCIKGWKTHEFIQHPERLKKPLIKKNGQLVEVCWDEALDYVAHKFKEIKEAHGSKAMACLSSAKCTNEENYVMQKFARAVLKTNNVDHCARLCHASTVAGLAAAFGSGAMTNSINELLDSKVILITGSNTTEQHPIIGGKILKAKEKGAKLIVVDPRETQLAKFADVHLRQLSGTDVPWLNSFMHVIFQEGLEDTEYIKNNLEPEAFEEMKKLVTSEKYSPESTEKITSIHAEDLRKAAIMFATNKPGSIVYAMGITQHIQGVDNVKCCGNLQMILGNIGVYAGGVNPLRGQQNVQGACDVGALSNVFSGYQQVVDLAARAKMAKAWNINVEDMDDKVGLTVVEIIHAAGEGTIKGLYIMGENPMVSDPDINHVKECLEKPFLVVQDIFMTPTAELADVVLPAASFAEKDGTFTSTQRTVSRIRAAIEPVGESKPDYWIIGQIAKRMGYEHCSFAGPKEILDEINNVTPSYAGITWERIDSGKFPFGIAWPCPNTEHPGTMFLHKDGKFTRGKGKCFACEYVPPAEEPDADYPFRLTTGRVGPHWHTGTMTRRSITLEREAPSAYIEINPDDATKLGVRKNQMVKVSSRRGEITLRSEVSSIVPRGVVFIPFHFVEAPANKLTISAFDPIAKIPDYKVCAVKIEKVR